MLIFFGGPSPLDSVRPESPDTLLVALCLEVLGGDGLETRCAVVFAASGLMFGWVEDRRCDRGAGLEGGAMLEEEIKAFELPGIKPLLLVAPSFSGKTLDCLEALLAASAKSLAL